jgi:hypothetical protein
MITLTPDENIVRKKSKNPPKKYLKKRKHFIPDDNISSQMITFHPR